MLHEVLATYSVEQTAVFTAAGPHDKKLFLLGKQMKAHLSLDQQKDIDRATKTFLNEVNEVRQKRYNMPSMMSTALPTPIEMTMKLSEEWEREEEKERRRIEQGRG